MSENQAKSIGIVSIKGGVGKTTSAANIGASLAQYGKKTLLIDADFTGPNLALQLGIIDPENTLEEVFEGDATIHDTIHNYSEHLDIIPCDLTGKKVNPYLLKEKTKPLKSIYDYIVIDAAPTLNDEMLSTIIASDELLIVTSPDYPTLSATLYAAKVADKKNSKVRGLILNRVQDKSFELTTKEIEETTEIPVIGTVKEDMKIPKSISETTPIAFKKPYSKVSESFKQIAAEISEIEYRKKGLFNKLLSWFR